MRELSRSVAQSAATVIVTIAFAWVTRSAALSVSVPTF
ncbi:hypothetical protein MGAST_01550 [Mycobacterium gastri 'Wayne']|nr:hypothetical protein MGAST_01550 [Mycobacterium gastri 'Wayne']